MSEREFCWYGYGHTEICLSASDVKQDKVGYEDERCSLIGDSFNMYSFMVFPWAALKNKIPPICFQHLVHRMGLARGFCSPIEKVALLLRKLRYGFDKGLACSVSELTRCFLARVNHTGSGVRVTTGAVMNPRAFPHQSVSAQWFKWKGVLERSL